MIVNKYSNGGGGSSSGVTPQEVQQQINSALTPYWDSGETKDYVDEALSGVSLDGYYTSAQTDAAIAQAVSGKADAKIVIDFDHTSQAERASLYADLYALYDGGSGATINRNYDFYKTVNTWQGLKIDYYGFSGDTLVFGKVVSPENLTDEVVYEQVMTIDSEGNVEVVTNIVGAASGGTDTEILKSYTGSTSELEEGDLTTYYSPTVCERLGMTYNGLEAEPQYSDRSGYTIQFPNIYSGSYAEFTEESPATLGTIHLTKQNPTGGSWTAYEILFYHDSSDNFCVKIKERDAATEYVFNLSAGTTNQYVFEDYTEFYMGYYKSSFFSKIQGIFLIGFQSPYDMPGEGSISVGVSNVQVNMKIGVVGNKTLIKLGDIERIDRNTAQIQNAVHSLSSRTGNFITSGQADTQITNKLAAYTPTSGFSTINGSAITSGGNIVIQGGSGDADLTPAFPRMPHLVLEDYSFGSDPLMIANIKSALFDDSQGAPASSLRLGSSNFTYPSENVEWGNADTAPEFTIDTQNLVAYVENIPAGEYTIMLNKFEAGENYDSAFTAHYFSKEGSEWTTTTIETTGEIWNNPDVDLDQYWRLVAGEGNEIAVTKFEPWAAGNFIWSFPKDVARFEIAIGNGGMGEYLEINTTYKEYAQASELASSGYLYYYYDYEDPMEPGYKTNLGDNGLYDFLKGNDGDGYSVDPPQLVDYDAYEDGSVGTPDFPKHLVTIYQSDYDDLVNNGSPDAETFYIVLPDPEP